MKSIFSSGSAHGLFRMVTAENTRDSRSCSYGYAHILQVLEVQLVVSKGLADFLDHIGQLIFVLTYQKTVRKLKTHPEHHFWLC